jgi:hypothetical protein
MTRRTLSRFLTVIALTILIPVVSNSSPAQAYPWDPHVFVSGSVSNCVPTTPNGWAWYDTSEGEKGWAQWGSSGQFTFQLDKVPPGGSLVSLAWGNSGSCQQKVFFTVTRPASSNQFSAGRK